MLGIPEDMVLICGLGLLAVPGILKDVVLICGLGLRFEFAVVMWISMSRGMAASLGAETN